MCLEESCPCGDGACMKFGKCEDEVCHCGAIRTNLHDGFYCKQYILDYDDNTDRIESGGILYCTKKSGCHTRDGRHYPQWTKIGFAGADNEHYAPLGGNRKFYDDLAYRDALSYHIDAGFDTTEESISPLGECVLDRKDNIRRFSEVRGETGDGAKLQYICDRQSCECGEKSCRIGEICNRGKCAPDSCQAHEKTRLICDVDLKTGQQSFPHPDNPDKCFIFTDIQRFSYLFHGWFMNRIYQDTLAEEIEDYNDASGEDIKYPIESKGQRYYDVMECKGGHRYCHGKNNSPIQIPDNPEGWLCKDVNSLPGITGTDHLKAWVCSLDSGCECGKDKCAYDKACINNQCVNVQLPVEMCDGIPLAKGYECKEMTYISSIVGNNDITGQICVQDMCVCGGSECPRSGLCRDGHCLFTDGSSYPIPPKNHQYDLASRRCMNKSGCSCRDKSVPYLSECDFPCFGDGSLDEDGYCWCCGHKLDDPQNETCFQKDDQYYVLCNRPEGCSCGNTKCPMSTYCAEEKCMDPLSGKPLPAFSGKLGPVVACSEEACPCDTETCAQGQFCVGGKCSDHYYMNISHVKRYNYSFLAIHKAKSFDDGYNHPDYVWNKILTTDISSLFTRQNVPDDEYVFSPYYRHEHCCCDSYNHFLEMDKFRCSLSSGCICGDGKCDYGEECIEGKCVQDDNYIDIFCGESQSDDPDIERISVDKSNCYCNGTVHPFITNFEDKYLCTWKGWQCNAPGGCACGNVRCNQEAYCIKPNLCSDPVVAEEAAFHHDQ